MEFKHKNPRFAFCTIKHEEECQITELSNLLCSTEDVEGDGNCFACALMLGLLDHGKKNQIMRAQLSPNRFMQTVVRIRKQLRQTMELHGTVLFQRNRHQKGFEDFPVYDDCWEEVLLSFLDETAKAKAKFHENILEQPELHITCSWGCLCAAIACRLPIVQIAQLQLSPDGPPTWMTEIFDGTTFDPKTKRLHHAKVQEPTRVPDRQDGRKWIEIFYQGSLLTTGTNHHMLLHRRPLPLNLDPNHPARQNQFPPQYRLREFVAYESGEQAWKKATEKVHALRNAPAPLQSSTVNSIFAALRPLIGTDACKDKASTNFDWLQHAPSGAEADGFLTFNCPHQQSVARYSVAEACSIFKLEHLSVVSELPELRLPTNIGRKTFFPSLPPTEQWKEWWEKIRSLAEMGSLSAEHRMVIKQSHLSLADSVLLPQSGEPSHQNDESRVDSKCQQVQHDSSNPNSDQLRALTLGEDPETVVVACDEAIARYQPFFLMLVKTFPTASFPTSVVPKRLRADESDPAWNTLDGGKAKKTKH